MSLNWSTAAGWSQNAADEHLNGPIEDYVDETNGRNAAVEARKRSLARMRELAGELNAVIERMRATAPSDLLPSVENLAEDCGWLLNGIADREEKSES